MPFCSVQSIPIDKIRHNDLPCYVHEGFGGMPIEVWPVYDFFRTYAKGEKSRAYEKFEEWYRDQLGKYHGTPKSEGGMHRGSLYTLIEEQCGPFPDADEICKGKAIRARIDARFRLLDDIEQNGYEPGRERIDAIRQGDTFILMGGHHRAAILKVLQKEELPGVLVFPNRFVYNLFNFLKTLKHGKVR